MKPGRRDEWKQDSLFIQHFQRRKMLDLASMLIASSTDSVVNINKQTMSCRIRYSGLGTCSGAQCQYDLRQIAYLPWVCFLISKMTIIPGVIHSVMMSLNKNTWPVSVSLVPDTEQVPIMTVIITTLYQGQRKLLRLSPLSLKTIKMLTAILSSLSNLMIPLVGSILSNEQQHSCY